MGDLADDMNPGYSVQPDLSWLPVMLGPDFRVDRGGITYPTPKETHMTDTNQDVLAAALELRKKLDEQIRTLQKQIHERAYPAPPAKAQGDVFWVDVKFQHGGRTYTFLLYRTVKGWFTTGTGDAGHFDSWQDLVDWLRGPDVYWHSDVWRLAKTGTTVMGAERNG